jgi:ATP-dependent helicase/nuclease subunit B
MRVPRKRLRILVHAPEDMADAFDELGCVRPEHWLRAEIELTDEQLAIVGHPSAQAREAAVAVARLDGAYAADEVVVGVPDEEVVPALEREFASAGVATRYMAGEGDERAPEFRMLTAGVPARYAAGVPMERTSPFRLLQAIADVLRDHSYESVAALARHPAFGDWLCRRRWQVDHPGAAAFRESDGWLAQLDTFLCERSPHTITGELGGAGGRGRAVAEALRTALLGDAMLGGLHGTRPLREWMPRLLALVLEIYGERALHRHIRDEQRLLAFAQKLREIATSFERVPSDLDETCDAATAIQVVIDGVAGEASPPDADDIAIELLGWLELHLDDAPVAILTGMNEPFVPEAVNADAFLPNALRSRLGMEDNDRRHARDAYQLTAMLHSRRVHVIAGRRTLLGDPLRPSRLLLATSGTTLARRVRTYLDDAGSAVTTTPGEATHDAPAHDAPTHDTRAPVAATVVGASRFALPPERVISLPVVPTSLRVTGFGAVLKDPYAWALDNAIGGDVVDDAQRELDPLRFGTLAHRVLEMFGKTTAAASADVDVVADALDACLDEYVAGTTARCSPPCACRSNSCGCGCARSPCTRRGAWRMAGRRWRWSTARPMAVCRCPWMVRSSASRAASTASTTTRPPARGPCSTTRPASAATARTRCTASAANGWTCSFRCTATSCPTWWTATATARSPPDPASSEIPPHPAQPTLPVSMCALATSCCAATPTRSASPRSSGHGRSWTRRWTRLAKSSPSFAAMSTSSRGWTVGGTPMTWRRCWVVAA